jgi:hypothetical protein
MTIYIEVMQFTSKLTGDMTITLSSVNTALTPTELARTTEIVTGSTRALTYNVKV